MDQLMVRNFEDHLRPLAGKGPHACLHLGLRNPSHAVWLLENVLVCADDTWFGTDDFGGSFNLFKGTLDIIHGFPNVKLYAMAEKTFLSSPPPEVIAVVGLRNRVTLVYLDSRATGEEFGWILRNATFRLRSGGVLVVNGYRMKRGRGPEVHDVVDEFLGPERKDWETMFENVQIGLRKR